MTRALAITCALLALAGLVALATTHAAMTADYDYDYEGDLT